MVIYRNRAELLNQLTSPNEEERKNAINVLRLLADRQLYDDLVQALLSETNPSLKGQLIEILVRFHNKGLVPLLFMVLKTESDPNLIIKALWGLGELQDYKSGDIIKDFLFHDDPKVREFALWSLANLKYKEAINDVLQALKLEKDNEVRRAAIKYLGSLAPNKQAFEALKKSLLNDPHEENRIQAAIELMNFWDPRAWEDWRRYASKKIAPEDAESFSAELDAIISRYEDPRILNLFAITLASEKSPLVREKILELLATRMTDSPRVKSLLMRVARHDADAHVRTFAKNILKII